MILEPFVFERWRQIRFVGSFAILELNVINIARSHFYEIIILFHKATTPKLLVIGIVFEIIGNFAQV